MSGSRKAAPGRLFPAEQLPPSHEPVLISACFLGIPCRWHGRRAKKRQALINKLRRRYVLVPICPEQLGGMPTPRTSETLGPCTTGADIIDGRARILAPETGEDVTRHHVAGGKYSVEIAQAIGARRAYMKGGSPSCDAEGVAGELLRRGGIEVVRVP